MRAASVAIIGDTPPRGEGTGAPRGIAGRSEVQLARSMAEYLVRTSPGSGAEALKLLRRMFPDSPLTVRVAALAALARR